MKISKQAIQHPMAVIFASLGIFIASIAAYFSLPLELVPVIEIPYAFVSATYIGAAPSEVETEIIKPIEEKLAQLQDVDDITGYAMQNVGFITIKFSPEADLDISIDDLKEKVNEAIPELREEIDNVTVTDIDFADTPISILNIYGDFSPHDLRIQADLIKDQLTRVSGVNQVEMFGGEEREIAIEIDPNLLLANNLSIPQVLMALRKSNMNFPGGTVKLKGQDIFVRTVGKYSEIDDIENTILGVDQSGNVKRIRDVGTVTDGFEIPSSYSRYQQQNSVTLLISKRTGAHIVEATEQIEAVVDKLAAKFPQGMEYAYTARQATDIEKQNSQLNQNAAWGILFVIIVLFAGIGFKNALIVSIALPFALMSSFPLMAVFDLARTGISMFGLIIVLGIVVDGAIIVAESTYRHMEEGLDRKAAAIQALDEVGVPIMTSVMTTMVAFAPIIYMTGTMGQFLSVIPKVVIFTLVGAFLADHFLIPVLASKLMMVTKRAGMLSGEWIGKRLYTRMVGWALYNRLIVILGITVVFFMSIAAVGISAVSDTKLVKLEIFPKVAKPRIILDINTPAGSQLDYTDAVVKEIEAYLIGFEEVDRIVSTVGESGVQNVRLAQGGGKGAEIAQINVDLVDAEDRDISVDDLMALMDAELSRIPGVEIVLQTIVEGPPIASNVIIDVSGDDLDAIGFVAEQVKRDLATVEGALNVESSLGVRRTEFQAVVDHDRAASYGLSSQEVSNTLAAAMIGLEATTYSDGLEDIPVVVRLETDGDDAVDAIRNLNIMNQMGQMIPFENVASLELGSSETLIKHQDFKRNISVSCDMAKGVDATDIRRRMDPFLAQLAVPNGVSVEYGGIEDEASESFASLGRAMMIGFIVIMIILSAQFQSIKQPLIIGLAIPLSFIGVILGLMITRVPFGIMAFFGVVALMGVVVNDAIVLIAYVNDLRKKGMRVREALIKAGRNRLRPIILTTVTTLAGMIPLSLNLAGGAEYWRPLAVSLIFGLAVSSFLTLIVVPVLYSIIESRAERKKLERAA
ncbi:MAG: efflux RND transporter permease subunit [Candidatus Marinimicrobia bacterium]|jgi:multidrug efflux pump subunit AcrB|nr:efflux RND transporter permease subunit [Candidatus Neomarinimicrobiota bacterium]MBT3576453.1 efflux RND transporter permease subunit [Candidatus Neomarinimicrobiota bacterium]MBT3680902.1 efflux RND transporter permease subunit [Candidatus Neomarinimicrobiota bacterium]MBT3949518.1 efflux RND transporter permease subunit [Candidatus Neomarinimicrobiota bacterium]MBT4253731.1 efflux RND transporter permease subunit [Candidatus Neomarinimicrobiota bacterium]